MPRIHPEIKLTGERNECPTCGELFNSNGAFDAHRRGKFGTSGPEGRRCLTADQMSAKGMVKTSRGFWARKLRGENAPGGFHVSASSHGTEAG
jgi:hypothetical protein